MVDAASASVVMDIIVPTILSRSCIGCSCSFCGKPCGSMVRAMIKWTGHACTAIWDYPSLLYKLCTVAPLWEQVSVIVTCVVVVGPVVIVGIVADASKMHFAAACRNAVRVCSTSAVPVVRACIIVIIVCA